MTGQGNHHKHKAYIIPIMFASGIVIDEGTFTCPPPPPTHTHSLVIFRSLVSNAYCNDIYNYT
jgi:hypothetical protein